MAEKYTVTVSTNGQIGVIGNMNNTTTFEFPSGTTYDTSGNKINFRSSSDERIILETVTVIKPLDTNINVYKPITT